MNNKIIKIIIPVVAIIIIAESIMLLTKSTKKVEPVVLEPSKTESLSLSWDLVTKDVKVGDMAEVALVLNSESGVAVDAVDLYVNYDPKTMTVLNAVSGKGFVTPSFNKISSEKGMIVMNFLVSEPTGFKLNKGNKVELARFKVNYIKEGMTEFNIGEGTLVVENATAKVLPFNSDKLVINVSR